MIVTYFDFDRIHRLGEWIISNCYTIWGYICVLQISLPSLCRFCVCLFHKDSCIINGATILIVMHMIPTVASAPYLLQRRFQGASRICAVGGKGVLWPSTVLTVLG